MKKVFIFPLFVLIGVVVSCGAPTGRSVATVDNSPWDAKRFSGVIYAAHMEKDKRGRAYRIYSNPDGSMILRASSDVFGTAGGVTLSQIKVWAMGNSGVGSYNVIGQLKPNKAKLQLNATAGDGEKFRITFETVGALDGYLERDKGKGKGWEKTAIISYAGRVNR